MRPSLRFRWFTVIMSVLALIGWLVHWHLQFNTTNVYYRAKPKPKPKPPPRHIPMTIKGCESIQGDSTRAYVQSVYGPDQGVATSDTSIPAVTYDYSMDFYNIDRAKTCMIFYGPQDRVSGVEVWNQIEGHLWP